MIEIPLDPKPNQSISITLDNIRYGIKLRDVGGIMSIDLAIDEELILQGHRVVGGLPIIPYKYLEGLGGNFIFETELGDIPYWDQFGATQSLIYFTFAELGAVRAD